MSGVYIKGLEMPEPGTVLAIKVYSNGLATVWDKKVGWKQHPAIPVPDHGRLIDADNLCKLCENLVGHSVTPNEIMRVSTIIPASKGGTA